LQIIRNRLSEYASGLDFLTREAVEAGLIVGSVLAVTEAGRAAVAGFRAAPSGITVGPSDRHGHGPLGAHRRFVPDTAAQMDDMRRHVGFISVRPSAGK